MLAPEAPRVRVAAVEEPARVDAAAAGDVGVVVAMSRWPAIREATAMSLPWSSKPVMNVRRRSCGVQDRIPACLARRFSICRMPYVLRRRNVIVSSFLMLHSSGPGVSPRASIHASRAVATPELTWARDCVVALGDDAQRRRGRVQMIAVEVRRFGAAQSATEQDGQQCGVAGGPRSCFGACLEQGAALSGFEGAFGGEPGSGNGRHGHGALLGVGAHQVQLAGLMEYAADDGDDLVGGRRRVSLGEHPAQHVHLAVADQVPGGRLDALLSEQADDGVQRRDRRAPGLAGAEQVTPPPGTSPGPGRHCRSACESSAA